MDEVEEILAREQQLGMGSTLTMRVNPAEKLTISQMAAKTRLSVSALMRMAVLEWMEGRYPDFNTRYYYNLERLTQSDFRESKNE